MRLTSEPKVPLSVVNDVTAPGAVGAPPRPPPPPRPPRSRAAPPKGASLASSARFFFEIGGEIGRRLSAR